MRRTPRIPALAVIAAVLIGGAVVDHRVDRTGAGQATAISGQVPLAAPASAKSSAWYCPGAALTPAQADATVVVANAGGRRLRGTVTVFPDKGDSRQAPVDVGPFGRVSVRMADVASGSYASAVVELDGGEAVADTVATGPLGETASACTSSASATWYFAEGVTTKDASEVLMALNPFPDDAVVDVVFSTEEGIVTPQALTGLSIRGQGMAAINVGEFVQRREAVAVSVAARTGRMVVSRLQTFDGTAGRKGISVGVGAAAPGPTWYFPEGLVADGQGERFQIYNPSAKEAAVELDLALETGEAEPLRLTVPRQARLTVVSAEESRIPKGVPHAVTARSTNGVGVVVERTIDAASPATHTGLSVALGARLPATRWAAAAGGTDEANDEWLVVQNPGARPAAVTVKVLADGAAVPAGNLSAVTVPPGQRKALHLNDALKRATAPVLVTSTEAVLVERDIYKLKGLGLDMGPAVPLG